MAMRLGGLFTNKILLHQGRQGAVLFLFALLLMSMPVPMCSQQSVYDDLLRLAHEAVSKDSLAKAETLFLQVVRDHPKDYRNALVYANMGKVQELQGKDMAALDSYTRALELSPSAVPMLNARADLYLRLGNMNKAVADYSGIIDIDPQNIHALSCRAYAYSKQRQYVEARQDYDRVLKMDSRNYAAQLGVATLCVVTGKGTEAMMRLNLLIEQYPDKAELYGARADMQKENKQLELALIDMDKAVELEPENAELVLARANLHMELGNKFYARRDFERAVALGVPRASLKEVLQRVK